MLEKDFQSVVIKLATGLGWTVAHFRTSAPRLRQMSAGAKGFPDLVLAHEKTGDVIFRELKRDGEKADPAQVAWGRLLRGQDYAVWRPADLEHIRHRLSHPRDAFSGCGHL